MIPEVQKAIYDQGKTVSGLIDGFWHSVAPDSAKEYAVFHQYANPFSRDSVNKFEDIYLQINVYSLSDAQANIVTQNMTNQFDDSEASFSLTNYYLIRIERIGIPRESVLDKTFMRTIQYKLQLQKK